MAIVRFSTGYRNATLDKKARIKHSVTGTTISFSLGTGAGGNDQVLDSANGLAGFSVSDELGIEGSAGNDLNLEILVVAAGAIDVKPSSGITNESAGAQVILATARGGSFSDLFKFGIIRFFAGSMPADADVAEGSSHILEITQASGAFSANSDLNGLLFGEVSTGILHQEADEIWSGVGLSTSQAAWFRLYANDVATGATLTGVRIDGDVATSGAAINVLSTQITTGGTTTVDNVLLTQPVS